MDITPKQAEGQDSSPPAPTKVPLLATALKIIKALSDSELHYLSAALKFEQRQRIPATPDTSPVAAYWGALFAERNATLDKEWEQPRQPVIISADTEVNHGEATKQSA